MTIAEQRKGGWNGCCLCEPSPTNSSLTPPASAAYPQNLGSHPPSQKRPSSLTSPPCVSVTRNRRKMLHKRKSSYLVKWMPGLRDGQARGALEDTAGNQETVAPHRISTAIGVLSAWSFYLLHHVHPHALCQSLATCVPHTFLMC